MLNRATSLNVLHLLAKPLELALELDGDVGDDERYELIRMILAARVGEAQAKPELVAAAPPARPYVALPTTASERSVYAGSWPIPESSDTVEIREQGDGLVIEFGEEPIRFQKVDDDHFVIEDHLEHVYFESGPADEKMPIVADLLLMEGRRQLEAGHAELAL